MNPLQQLNEYLAKNKMPSVVFEHTHKGPDNIRTFKATTTVFGKRYVGATANTKREASHSCARKVLEDIGKSPGKEKLPRALSSSSDELEEVETLDSSSDEEPPSQQGVVGIVDYENMPGAVDLFSKLSTTYIVLGANHPKCDSLVAKPPNNTIIIVQPSSLRDASDTMIVLLVGMLASLPTPPSQIVVATRDKFASIMMAVVNGQPYQVSPSGERTLFPKSRVSVVTTETQIRKLGF